MIQKIRPPPFSDKSHTADRLFLLWMIVIRQFSKDMENHQNFFLESISQHFL